MNEPHPVSADFGEIPTVEAEENEEEIETDSIATTVQVIISIFEINRIIFINILFDKNILMNTENFNLKKIIFLVLKNFNDYSI